MDKLIIIDGNSLLNRAYYAIQMPLKSSRGEPTNAVYGFTTMLNKLLETERPAYVAVAFDLPAPTFRHKMYAGYKASRKGMPDELAVQIPILKRLLAAMGIKTFEMTGYEADDIIGTVSVISPAPVAIVTGDRDSLQLISDKTVVYLTKKGLSEIDKVDSARLLELYGLTPPGMIELKSLMGDASDCIPGVPGVGEKTALDLLNNYKTLDGVYENIDKTKGKLRERLEENKELAYLSYKLAVIDTRVPIDFKLEEMRTVYPFPEAALEIFAELNFKSLIKQANIKNPGAAAEYKTEPVKAPVTKSERLRVVLPEVTTEIHTAPGAVKLGAAAIVFGEDLHFSDGAREIVCRCRRDLLSEGASYDVWLTALKGYFEDAKIPKILFESKAVRHELARYGIELRGEIFDVQLAQYVIDYALVSATLSETLQKEDMSGDTPAAALFALSAGLKTALNGYEDLYYNIELPLSDVLFEMERTGFRVDVGVLDELGARYRAELERLTNEIYDLAGVRFNINSPKQIGEVLFDKMGLGHAKKSKSGAYGTGADILEKLAEDNPVAQLILQHRALSKLNGTYVEGLKRLVKADGVMHTEFRQAVTATGRLSSAEPNLQNIPIREEEGREIRRAFIARDGCVLISADYSQIELRLLADFSGEEALIASFCAGEDIHRRTAGEVNGVPIEQVTGQMRREAKAVNFGIIYGISNFGLAQGLGIAPSKAKEIITKYFENYPKVRAYLDGIKSAARRDGYIKTLFGRVRYFPELSSPNFNVRAFGERAAMNMPLQGAAADIMKLAMIKVNDALRESGIKAKLILQVHDELIVEADASCAKEAVALLKAGMEDVVKLKVPLTADISESKSWFGM
ncbi:MAG: DNA polymerase I [Clostridiales bacterium]|jgi:DNA polymerase-1|nr:DNA polymerase I [Clostridiales bacterium]